MRSLTAALNSFPLKGGHRVPFILYWKGRIQPEVSDVPVLAMDLFPTLSELIGAALPSDRIYDGVSLTPLFEGGELTRPELERFYYYNCENLQAVRVGDWKHLSTDPAEHNNVAAEHPERVSEMMALAEQTREELGEYMKRGSEQRATGTLFLEVPILSNHTTDWANLSDAEKGRAKTEFPRGHASRKKEEQAISRRGRRESRPRLVSEICH